MQEVDYLTEDKPLPKQKFVVLSILSPKFIKTSNEFDNIRGIKIRGSYETYDEAQKRAEYLQKIDPSFNVFIGEVGKWLPFDDSPDNAEDTTYGDKKLNNLMKEYLKKQEEAKELYEKRKNEEIMKVLSDKMKLNEDKPFERQTSRTDLNTSEVNINLDEETLKLNKLQEEIMKVKELLNNE